jgi:hypothetical protein
MMPLDTKLVCSHVNLITGFSSGCGKTSLAKAMMALLRMEGKRAALLTAGYEAGRATAGSAAANRIELLSGEAFSTSAASLPFADCRPQIEAGPFGSSALGPIVLARAGRSGNAILVGPGQNEALADASREALGLPGIDAVIIDGTLSRLTQLSHLPEALLFCAVMADRANQHGIARRMEHFFRLVNLPQWNEGSSDRQISPACRRIEGPLTSAVLHEIYAERSSSRHKTPLPPLVVEDMAHVFLSGQELEDLASSHMLFVAHPVRFAGFVLTLRDLSPEDFAASLPSSVADHILCGNPYEQDACTLGGAA